MRRRVSVQAAAQDDLLSILTFISGDSIASAESVITRLENAILELGTAALRYQVLKQYSRTGIRRRVVGSYNILFRATDRAVDVLRIVHGARDIVLLLPGDD